MEMKLKKRHLNPVIGEALIYIAFAATFIVFTIRLFIGA